MMFKDVYQRKNIKRGLARKSKFRRNLKELKEFIKENDIKLLELLECLRRRNNKKIQKETINVKNNP